MSSESPSEPKSPLRLGDPENFRSGLETPRPAQATKPDKSGPDKFGPSDFAQADFGIDDLLNEPSQTPLIKAPPPTQPPSTRPSQAEKSSDSRAQSANKKAISTKSAAKPDNGFWFWSGMGVLCLLWASASLAFILELNQALPRWN